MNRWMLQMTLFSSLVLLAGCAFGTRHVTLTYPPPEGGDREAGVAIAATTLPATSGREVTLVRFVDRRTRTDSVGKVQNALGMTTASVVTASDVSGWVTSAVAYELKKAGYLVNTVAKSDEKAGAPILSGEILNLDSSAYFSYEGEVKLFARLISGEQKLIAKEYTGTGSSGVNWAMTEEGYAETLSRSLADLLARLVQDVNIALTP